MMVSNYTENKYFKLEVHMSKKKIVKVSVPSEIYTNFLPSGTVIDRPGLPLLKIVDAKQIEGNRVSVDVEVSPSFKQKGKSA